MNRYLKIGTIIAMGLAAAAAAQKPLRIYLPADVKLNGEAVELGQVGILLGEPELVEQASAVSLGTFAMEGQSLLVDRNTILSRLASAGIRSAQVQMHGAETVRIGRHEITLSAERIIACAQAYLERTETDPQGIVLSLLRPPQPQVLSADDGPIELAVTEMARQGGGVRKLRVAILRDGKAVGGEDVFFTVRYRNRRIVAAEELTPGTVLTSENIRVETFESDRPEPDGWSVPYGMAARHRIAAGAAVTEALLEPRQEPILIRRRQNVVVRIDNGLLFITTTGESMDDGRIGEIIRVRRGQRPHERIIVCRIQADGTVEPIL